MDIAKIDDLQINTQRKLNNDTKRQLVKIIEAEFSNQRTIYDANIFQQREKILENFRKEVGFTLLKQKFEEAQLKVKQLEEKISDTGLDVDGGLGGTYGLDKDSNRRRNIERINKVLDAINNTRPLNIQNKIISRLWMADNMGEAMVILHEVLGNGIIPTISKDQLRLSYQETK